MSTTTTTTSYAIEVIREDVNDFAMLLNGELVGYAKTRQAGEDQLNALVTSLLARDAATPAPVAPAAELAGDEVTLVEVLDTATGRTLDTARSPERGAMLADYITVGRLLDYIVTMNVKPIETDGGRRYQARYGTMRFWVYTTPAPTADAALASHLVGELREVASMQTAALAGERYAGETDDLDAAYDRKKAQIEALGYAVVGPELELAEAARPRCPKCGEQLDSYGRCGCDYASTVNTLVAEAVAATRRAYEPDAEERAEVEAWLAELDEAEEIPTPVSVIAAPVTITPALLGAILDDWRADAAAEGERSARAGDSEAVAFAAARLRAVGRARKALDAAVAAEQALVVVAPNGETQVKGSEKWHTITRESVRLYCPCDHGQRLVASERGQVKAPRGVCWHSVIAEAVADAVDAVAAELDDQAEYRRLTQTTGRMAA